MPGEAANGASADGRIFLVGQALLESGQRLRFVLAGDVADDLLPHLGVGLVGRVGQRGQGVVTTDAAQHPRGGDAHGVKRVVLQRVFQFAAGGFVFALGHQLDGLQAAKRVAFVGQLRVQQRGRRREAELGQQRYVGVDPHDLRRLGQAEIKILRCLSDMQRAVDRLAIDGEAHRQFHVKEQHVGIDLLFLLYAELGELGFLVPSVTDFQFGMVRVKNVLIKKAIERLARNLLDD